MKYHLTKHLATIPAFKSSNLLLSTFTGWLTNHASRWLSPSRVGYHTDSPITLQHLLYSRCWFSKLVRDPNTNNIPWFWLRGACGVQNLTPLQNHVVNMFWNVWRQFANLSENNTIFSVVFCLLLCLYPDSVVVFTELPVAHFLVVLLLGASFFGPSFHVVVQQPTHSALCSIRWDLHIFLSLLLSFTLSHSLSLCLYIDLFLSSDASQLKFLVEVFMLAVFERRA